MSLDPAVLHVIRETLEERLSRRDTAAILLDALGTWASKGPAARANLGPIIHGTLREALLRHLAPRDADVLLQRVDAVLADVNVAPASPPPAPRPVEERSTVPLPKLEGAATVLVASGTDELAVNLTVALGSYTVLVRTANSLELLAEGVVQLNDFVIVDARMPISGDFRALARALRGYADCLCVVWGSDLAHGPKLVAAIEAAGVRTVPVAVSGGVASLLDLVTSRAPPRRR